LALNLDATTYGTFAEIGAGQEVARWFFSVGGAAGTVAKTILGLRPWRSARDSTDRRKRLRQPTATGAMLDQEFAQLLERLASGRGDSKKFFVFADTAATRSYGKSENGRGWLGISFSKPSLARTIGDHRPCSPLRLNCGS